MSPSPNQDSRRNADWKNAVFNLFFASFGFVAIRFLFTPIRIKLLTSLLSKEEYGTLTLIMVTISFASLLSSMGSFEFMLRRIPGQPAEEQFSILHTVVHYFGLIALIASLLIGGMLFILPANKLSLGVSEILACMILLLLTVHISQLIYFLMGRSQYGQSRLLMLLQVDVWFLPLIVFLWFGRLTVEFMLWFWAAWLVVTLGISQIFVRTRRIFQSPASRPLAGRILHFGIPLLPMILGLMVFQIIDRYALLAFTDLETLANFTLAFNLTWVGAYTGLALLDVLITEFFKVRNRYPEDAPEDLPFHPDLRLSFNTMLRFALLISCTISTALLFAGAPLIRFLSTQAFLDAVPIMQSLSLLPPIILLVTIHSKALIALDRSRVVGAGTLIAIGLHALLSALLIPLLQARGSALASFLSYSTLAVYLGLRFRVFTWIDRKDLRPFRLLLHIGICSAGFLGSVAWISHPLAALICGGVIALISMFATRCTTPADFHHLMSSIQTTGETPPATETADPGDKV